MEDDPQLFAKGLNTTTGFCHRKSFKYFGGFFGHVSEVPIARYKAVAIRKPHYRVLIVNRILLFRDAPRIARAHLEDCILDCHGRTLLIELLETLKS